MMTPLYGEREYPKISDTWATLCVAISIIIMGYSHLFSIVPILIFYAIWLPRIYYKDTFILFPSGNIVLMALFPLLCIFSFFWSDDPGQTLYKSIEFASLIVCMAIIARVVSIESFIKGIIIGVCTVLISTFLTGNFATVSYSGESALVGFMGSKNQVGFFATIGIVSAISYFFAAKTAFEKIAYVIFPALLGFVCLYLSHSASSVLSLAVALLGIGIFTTISLVPKGFNYVVFGLWVFFLLTAMTFIVAFDFDIYGKILEAFGKSKTLTGRTDLWEIGYEVGMKKPLTGYGYSAFWIEGRPEAELIAQEYNPGSKFIFNFHNNFMEAFVSLGIPGTLIIAFLTLFICVKATYYALRDRINIETCFFICFSYMFLVRAFVEVGVLGPFGIGPFLFFFLIAWRFRPSRSLEIKI